ALVDGDVVLDLDAIADPDAFADEDVLPDRALAADPRAGGDVHEVPDARPFADLDALVDDRGGVGGERGHADGPSSPTKRPPALSDSAPASRALTTARPERPSARGGLRVRTARKKASHSRRNGS